MESEKGREQVLGPPAGFFLPPSEQEFSAHLAGPCRWELSESLRVKTCPLSLSSQEIRHVEKQSHHKGACLVF